MITEVICKHESYTIEPPCCKYPYEDGRQVCACGGEHQVICDNDECDGMPPEQQIEILTSEGYYDGIF